MDPLTRGEYPLSMRALVRNRLPQFTKEQSELVKGAFDFIGLNYYTTNYADNLLNQTASTLAIAVMPVLILPVSPKVKDQ